MSYAKKKGLMAPIYVVDSDDGESCPLATTDVTINTKNRNYAIKEHGYGPLNPDDPSENFWSDIADLWDITEEEAKVSRCENCAAFIQTPHMISCIEGHVGLDKDYEESAEDFRDTYRHETAKASNLGYCQLFGFKCAGKRVCNAWVHGGPIT